MTVTAGEKNAAGQLRDAAGRKVYVSKAENAPLASTDVPTSLGIVDADGREHIVILGVVGEQGPAGAGALGFDLWASQGGAAAGITDWGPLYNAAIAAHPRVLLSAHDFPFSTALDHTSVTSLVVDGESGGNWPDNGMPASGKAARLIWKGGAGSGAAVKFGNSDGVTFRNVVVMYDNAAYNGDLTDWGNGGIGVQTKLENCRLGSSSLSSARCLVRWENTVGAILRDVKLSGAVTCLRGRETTNGLSNDNIIDGLVTARCTTHIMNIGLNWRIKDHTMEFSNCPAGAVGWDSDITTNSVFWADNCTWWDTSSGATQIPVRQKSTNDWNAVFRGGYVDGGFAPINFQLNGPGVIDMEGMKLGRATNNATNALIDCGTTGAGAHKYVIRIRNCSLGVNDDTDLPGIINLDGGHDYVDTDTLRTVTTSGGIERLFYTNQVADHQPTIAVHAGQPALTVDIRGNCRYGHVYIRNFTGSPTVAGKLLDFTLPPELIIPGVKAGFTHYPVVHFEPLGDTDFSIPINNSIDAGHGVTTSAGNTFQLNVRNATPAGQHLAFAYRIGLL